MPSVADRRILEAWGCELDPPLLAMNLSGKKEEAKNEPGREQVPEICHQFASLVCNRMKFTSHAFDRTNNEIDTKLRCPFV